MLRILNKYSHGFVAIPVIIALKKAKFFGYMEDGETRSLEKISSELQLNSGYLRSCLSIIEVLGWITLEEDGFKAHDKMCENKSVPDYLLDIYNFNADKLDLSLSNHALEEALSQNIKGWDCADPMNTMLEGASLIPLLLTIKGNDLLEDIVDFNSTKIPLVALIRELFLVKKWGNISADVFSVTRVGEFMINRSMVTGVTASYSPLLKNIFELLTGDIRNVFNKLGSGESHVNRTLNVLSSGFQHVKYFSAIENVILNIFDKIPIDEQPDFIADMGCGDGSFLKSIYDLIVTRTKRGKELADRPITLIGADYNEKALIETEMTLNGLPHITLFGDVGDPGRLMDELRLKGVNNPNSILHVRSFLDHNRIFMKPEDSVKSYKKASLPCKSVGIDEDGNLISTGDSLQSLVEHLGKWKKVLAGNGLVCLEVHAQSLWAKKEYFDITEGLHFDALHAFSKQYLVEADYFLMAMAEVGLFSEITLASFPKGFDYTRITIGHFKSKPYTIQFLTQDDLSSLDSLESQNGVSIEQLSQQVEKHPDCNFLLKNDEGDSEAVILFSIEDGVVSKNAVVSDLLLNKKSSLDGRKIINDFCMVYFQVKDGFTV